MSKKDVLLNSPERFEREYQIPERKLEFAIEKALDVLEKNMERFGDRFPQNRSEYAVYKKGEENNNWTCGLFTGTYWLAYELSGERKFKEFAEKHINSFFSRVESDIEMDTHDVGFCFSPSCVAAYKITGDKRAKQIAIAAAEKLMHYRWCERDGFIWCCGHRIIVDTMINIPLLFWASEETGDDKFRHAAISHYKNTLKYLVRDDYSTYHHFEINEQTGEPIRGVTLQGYSDESCWSRGHAWTVYGFPIAYSYTKDESLVDVSKNLAYYALNHLPEDLIPYWDFDFVSGDEPRDSSAGAICVCGMMDMCRYLPDSAPQKKIFKNASAMMLEALIDNCTTPPHKYAEGLLYKTSGAVPFKISIEDIAPYGDYPYLEALTRFVKPSWERYL